MILKKISSKKVLFENKKTIAYFVVYICYIVFVYGYAFYIMF